MQGKLIGSDGSLASEANSDARSGPAWRLQFNMTRF